MITFRISANMKKPVAEGNTAWICAGVFHCCTYENFHVANYI